MSRFRLACLRHDGHAPPGAPSLDRLPEAKHLTKRLTCGIFLVEKSVLAMRLSDLWLSLPS